jgi:hypothetical protein
MSFKIITCPTWGAVLPRSGLGSIVWTPGQAKRIIFHHTAGHFRELARPGNESVFESIVYARDIQHFHMRAEPRGRGWNDSGHNFLVARRMVVSAHCPEQNDQIGIEHEHDKLEEMPRVQKEASAYLQAWIADKYRLTNVLPVDPHRKYYKTSCPANLVDDIAEIREMAQRRLRLGSL